MKRFIVILAVFTWIGAADAGLTDGSSQPAASAQPSQAKADTYPLKLAQKGDENKKPNKGKKDPPPLETKVILNDPKPPRQVCKLLVQHAFSECRNGTWHVVTRATFQCGATQIVKETHVIRTNQPCTSETQAPSLFNLIPFGLPNGCGSPVIIRTFTASDCVNLQVYWKGFELMQCADKRFYLRRYRNLDKATTKSCNHPERLPR